MSRYRPPRQRSSNYITQTGQRQLYDELSHLWHTKRPRVTQTVSEAAAQGDRSENAEYIYGKKQLREIDKRIRFLQKRLDHLIVVDRPPDDQSKIFFGAWVRVVNDADEECEYRIVGADELDPKQGYISVDSPLAKALLGKSVDDDVIINSVGEKLTYSIVDIVYK